MRIVLAPMDLDDALLGFDKMPLIMDVGRKTTQGLQCSISDSPISIELDSTGCFEEENCVVLWLKLEQLRMSKSLTSKLHRKQWLYHLRISKGTPLEDHLIAFKDIAYNLEALVVKYEEEDLQLILLWLLCSSHSTFRDTILHSRDIVILDEVMPYSLRRR